MRHPDRDRLSVYGSWRKRFCDDGQVLIETHRKAVLRASLPHYERALRLLNSVIGTATERGYKISMQRDDERLELQRDGATVTLRLSEKLEQGVRKEQRSWDQTWENVKTLTPTGRLTVFLAAGGGGESGLSDQPKNYLEQQVEAIMTMLDAKHAASVKWEEERRQWHIEWEERHRREAEQARLADEARKRAAEEKTRRANLVSEAEAWLKATDLRRYLTELDRRLAEGGVGGPDFAEWRAWAEVVANDLDRSVVRVQPDQPRVTVE